MLQWLVISLIFFFLLEPVKQQKTDACETSDNISAALAKLVEKSNTQLRELQSLRKDITSLKDSVRRLNDSLVDLSSSLAGLNDSLVDLSSSLAGLNDSQADFKDPSLPVHTCGGTGEWRRVVYLDMTDPSTTCPSGWQETGYSKRTCGKTSHTGNFVCDPATFPVNGGEYSRVCGRIKAYQYGGVDAFEAYNIREGLTINDAYVSGISLTYGSPRKHIWTFAAGATDRDPTANWICPCDATVDICIPPFVNQDYFCETAIRGPWNSSDHNHVLFTDDPLWDGKGCGSNSTTSCCKFNSPPYFTKQLSSPTTDSIEARICIPQPADNVAVELLELFVQ